MSSNGGSVAQMPKIMDLGMKGVCFSLHLNQKL